MLLLGQWSPIPADLAVVLRPPRLLCRGVAAAFLGLLLFAMAPLLRRDPLARFWAAGMLLATVPVSATVPGDRLLTFVGIGAAGLLAQFWAFVFAGEDVPASALWRVPARAVAWFLVVVHAVDLARSRSRCGPATRSGRGGSRQRLYVRHGGDAAGGPDRRRRERAEPHERELPGPPPGAGGTVRAPAHAGPGAGDPLRDHPPPRRADARDPAPKGAISGLPLDRVFRSERRGFAVGEQVKLTGMTVTITALTADGRPAEATFRFDVPLESPSLLWLCFRGDGFEPFTPPAVGEEVEIRFDWKALLSPSQVAQGIHEPGQGRRCLPAPDAACKRDGTQGRQSDHETRIRSALAGPARASRPAAQ